MGTKQITEAQVQQAKELLTKWFTSGSPCDWGSKAYLVNRLAKEVGITKKAATEVHKAWAEEQS